MWKDRSPILTDSERLRGERGVLREACGERRAVQGARVAGHVDIAVGVSHAVRLREADALQSHNTWLDSRTGTSARERAGACLVEASPERVAARALVKLAQQEFAQIKRPA